MMLNPYYRKGLYLFLVLCCIVSGFSFRGKYSTTSYPFAIPSYFPKVPVNSLQVTVDGASLGRFLFYDPILSRDSTISCASCHKQAVAFGDSNIAFSKGIGGTLQKRNTPPLFNLLWSPGFFWDGRAADIESQVSHPLRQHDEMNMQWSEVVNRLRSSKFYRAKFRQVFGSDNIDSTLISDAIGQFERTIISCNSKYDRVLQGRSAFSEDESKGFVLINDMTKGDCLHCHTTDSDPLGTTFAFSNNGLDTNLNPLLYKDKGRGGITNITSDYGKFKIPSLRNVGLTAPYMHDGRFKTLEEVLNFYSDGVNMCANIDSKMEFANQHGTHLTSLEKKQIIAFLHTLTDSALIYDKRFSNPFVKISVAHN
jgi:cytochrome c peroxidase